MCKHSNLMIGEVLVINWSDGKCDPCGNKLPSGSGEARYEGHTESSDGIEHLFVLLKPIYCPSCFGRIELLREYCDDPPFYWFETIEEEEYVSPY